MAKLIINLSGQKGLGKKFFGDSDQITPTPQRRYDIAEGEMAQGLFNPFIREGYLSPAITTFQAVTANHAIEHVIGSTVYDAVGFKGYYAERGENVFRTNTELVLAFLFEIAQDAAEVITITDLEIYQLAGIRRLFYAYKRITGAEDTLDDNEPEDDVGDVGIYNLREIPVIDFVQGSRFITTAT